MNQNSHFNNKIDIKPSRKPDIRGRMTIIYPDSMNKKNRVLDFAGIVPNRSDIESELNGKIELIESYKKNWQIDNRGREVLVNCICFGQQMSRYHMPLNEDASNLHFSQAGWELSGRDPAKYALYGPIVLLTGTRAFMNRI